MVEMAPYRVEHLLLLVGTNPLPNYVAALLLTQEQSTVYLLHTSNTLQVAERLCEQIKEKRPHLTLISWEIHKSDPQRIDQRLESLKREMGPNANVGLNYTGGSKPMAVQAYYTLHAAYPRGVFSYLDADTLSLIIEAPGLPTQQVFVGQSVRVDFKTLFALHDYEITPSRREAKQPEFCRSLVDVHMTRAGMRQWYRWRRSSLPEPHPFLPAVAEYPLLEPVIEAFDLLSQGQTSAEAAIARALGYSSLRSCTEFFKGRWLEEYVFDALVSQADALELEDWAIGLELQKVGQRPMEIDIAAVRGYQLFAISCIVTEKASKAKEHLLEVFVRARQIGGDEARFAVVCFVDEYLALQDEVSEQWDARGKIRVFGRDHMPDLAQHFNEWIATASRLR